MAKPSSQWIAQCVIDHFDDNEWVPLKDVCYEALRSEMREASQEYIYEIIEENFGLSGIWRG